MLIANYKEYISTLRELFAGNETANIVSYAQDLKDSGHKQKQAKEALQKEIALIHAKIKQLRAEIAAADDKASVSILIKRQQNAKQALVRKLKARDRTSRFSVLQDSTKAALCTLEILRKYMTKEILENQFLNMAKDTDGNVIFNRYIFENSQLFDDATHIFDYVSVYLQQNPAQVTSETFFNKFFDKQSGWRGIVHCADTFFEQQNKAKRKKTRAEIIAESQSDIELIKEYPTDKVILVRCKTPEALDYEGAAAHNCVGGGSYDKLLSAKNSGIYSLRRATKDGELKPVVTIEYKDGKVCQIRGVCNTIVPYGYSLPARDVVMMLLDKQSVEELVKDSNTNETVLNNIGLYRDGKGGYLDIHNLSGAEDFELPQMLVSAESLKDYEWEKLKISSVEIVGSLKSEEASELNRFIQAKSLTVSNLEGVCHIDLGVFDRLERLTVKSEQGAACRLSGRNTTLKNITLSKTELVKNENLNVALEKLNIQEMISGTIELSNFPQVKEINLEAKENIVCDLIGENKSLRSLVLRCVDLKDMSDGKYPALETLESNCSSNNFLNLSAFPNLKELIFFSNLNKQTVVAKMPSASHIELTGKSLHLQSLKATGIVLENLDKIEMPELSKLICYSAMGDGFDISRFGRLECLELTTKQTSTVDLRGINQSLQSLRLIKAAIKNISLERFPALKELYFQDANLTAADFIPPHEISCTYKECALNQRIVRSIIASKQIMNESTGNKVQGKHFDFSDLTECVSLSAFLFPEAETFKFASSVKTFIGTVVAQPNIRIEGLNNIEEYHCRDSLFHQNLNPLSVKKLHYNNFIQIGNGIDLREYANVEELYISRVNINDIPMSVKKLHINLGGGIFLSSDTDQINKKEAEIYDFSRLSNLREIEIAAMDTKAERFKFPDNIEKISLLNLMRNLEELDFRNCRKLKETTLKIIAEKLKTVYLPDSLEHFSGNYSSVGIGIEGYGFSEKCPVRFIVPNTAKPEIISYLQKQWGNERVEVATKAQVQAPKILMLQKGSKQL